MSGTLPFDAMRAAWTTPRTPVVTSRRERTEAARRVAPVTFRGKP